MSCFKKDFEESLRDVANKCLNPQHYRCYLVLVDYNYIFFKGELTPSGNKFFSYEIGLKKDGYKYLSKIDHDNFPPMDFRHPYTASGFIDADFGTFNFIGQGENKEKNY